MVTQQEHTETIEHTLAELENQQLTVQQLVTDALSDLEVLYSEMEENAQWLKEVSHGSNGTYSDPSGSGNPVSEEAVAEMEADLESLRDERRQLESALSQLRQELEEAARSGSNTEGGSPFQRPSLPPTLISTAATIRGPFERLREQLAASEESSSEPLE